jgi:hypothetical protein
MALQTTTARSNATLGGGTRVGMRAGEAKVLLDEQRELPAKIKEQHHT